jgi:glucose/arabinose dehydrogenase
MGPLYKRFHTPRGGSTHYDKQVTLGLARGRLNGRALTDVKDIFVAGPGTSDASRLAFGPDGTLVMTTGGGCRRTRAYSHSATTSAF